MGKKSNMRKFKRRRQRAGFVLLSSLVLVVLGTVLFWKMDASDPGLETAQISNAAPVQRVEAPDVAGAPRAVADRDGGGDGDGGGNGGEAAGVLAAEEEDKKTAAEKQEAKEEAQAKAAEREAAKEERAQRAKKKEQASKPPAQPPVPATSDLWLDVPKLGLYDNYVVNSNAPADMDAGAVKMVETAFPWQNNANTYISAHRLGWPGTASDHQFYNLPLLGYGDRIYVTDANGTTYTYEVTEFYEVAPNETWVTAPVAGRDMISLQTCIENYGDYWTMGPNWYVRYVVRADRVDWQTA